MTMNQNNLRHRMMMLRFSMWDLHLYLDTHPCDKTAAELLEKYKEELKTALKGKSEARIKQLEDELTKARDNYVDMYISLSDDKRDTVKHREMEDKYCDLYEQSQNVFDLDDEFEL